MLPVRSSGGPEGRPHAGMVNSAAPRDVVRYLKTRIDERLWSALEERVYGVPSRGAQHNWARYLLDLDETGNLTGYLSRQSYPAAEVYALYANEDTMQAPHAYTSEEALHMPVPTVMPTAPAPTQQRSHTRRARKPNRHSGGYYTSNVPLPPDATRRISEARASTSMDEGERPTGAFVPPAARHASPATLVSADEGYDYECVPESLDATHLRAWLHR